MSNRIGTRRLITVIKTISLAATAFAAAACLTGCAAMFSDLWMPRTVAEFEIDLSKTGSIEKKIDFGNHKGRETSDGIRAVPYHVEILDESLEGGYWPELLARWDGNKRMHRMSISIKIYDGDSLFFEIPTDQPTTNASYRNALPLGSFFLPAIDERKTYDVRVQISGTDSLLAKRMVKPRLWINQGGGK